ncbi:MAG: hypothetical protein WBF26_12420 [Candidatus Sulfotelmatobacter sp.]
MRFGRGLICAVMTCLLSGALAFAQGDQSSPTLASTATVPRLIRIRGAVRDEAGQPLSGAIGVTFALYADQNDQTALWQESQTVQLDSGGNYSVLLGASNEEGLPQEVFSAGEARWLGVRPEGQAEQPRILLLSVAYALKAADTDMLGGKPASAFMLADSQSSSVSTSTAQEADGAQAGSRTSQSALQAVASGSGIAALATAAATTCTAITSDGTATVNQIAKFTTACNIENSAIFESGGSVGIGNTSPVAKLDVSGTSIIRGSLTAQAGAIFPPTAAATTTQGFDSNPLDLEAASYNTTLLRSIDYIFQWQAEPTGNDSTNTGATLNLLYGVSGDVSETGLSIAKNGILTFASGQTFPVAGTVTSISTGAGLTGGPITKTGTISIPAAGVTNSMLADSSIKVVAGSGLSGGGTVALGGTVTLANASPSSGGTVTSISTGAGLTGGTITKTGTISIPAAGVTNSMLADSSIKVLAGSGLSGGGTVALGGSVTLSGNISGTADGIAYFSSPAGVTSTAAPTDGQILIGSTGDAPALGTLTAGANIKIANNPGSITISATQSAFPFFVTGGARTGTSQAATENTTKLWGLLLPYPVTTIQITYSVTTADDTANEYDIGIYNTSGTLLVDIGATPGTSFAASTGFHTLLWTQGSTGLTAGEYYLGMTTNCASACAQIAAATGNVSFAVNLSAGASTGGALPSTMTVPAQAWATGNQPTAIIH